ncbi:2Fe-2S iron-sulfur cluster-binding protein [Microbispora amethystogenes]|uniref:Sarcosine oxidase subunit alpha n=1 Tax=Microbispora amethystogenes TaxID=1427754 RepID=A0ABQ4FNR7_9ACTN|nr:2Fe-2S iron-sulfur cluster-binding protein [Microbispora amethystogenes]GIH36455.1 sarcosine oxidase subunit alpha [Microbispora amethystogenes]
MSTQPYRREGVTGRVLRFRFDGRDLEGLAGDTLASALLAGGVRAVATSVRLGRPRGVYAAGCEEPNAVVQIEEPFPEPMLTATTVELYDGLVATGLAGRGRLADRPDPARYDAVHAHCDVLVVGAGPAGIAAARVAARAGARVILADERPEPGGSLLGTTETVDGGPGRAWAAAEVDALAALPETRVLRRTTVIGHYDDNYIVAVERRTNHLGAAAPPGVARERVWRIRAKRVVLATGGHERFVAFAGNDLPGVMLAGAARTYVNQYGVLPGRRAVVFTTNDTAYAAALDLADAGIEIAAVADVRREPGRMWAARCAERGIEVLTGHVVTAAKGEGEVTGAEIAPRTGGRAREVAADLLLVSGGWTPVVHLFSQAGGTLRYDEGLGAFTPGETRQAAEAAGFAAGVTTLRACLADGAEAGRRALAALGFGAPGVTVPVVEEEPAAAPAEHLWLVESGDYGTHFVDLQRDVTVAEVLRATGAGLTSVEHVKRYTTAGTAHDQGKTSGQLTGGVVAHALGVDVAALGTTTFRAPYTPVSFAALAGRDRGPLHDPVRTTPMHEWHVARGALFENVGQWKRPWYYPGLGEDPGEDMEDAVLRECAAVREGAGAMDASTLGKIDVVGPDAGVFLDRLYTNMMSTLKVGSIRYGVMCRPDGMVFDDGTAIRLADDHYLVTTTTGNAAAVLDWMEEWLQTEWPDLRVRCTSVTEQWATVALAGPRSREVLAALAPGLAVGKDDFPFMTWRDAEVAGIDARVCRISFSGELAYEINVSSWHGLALWEAVMASGEVTPYGTETMHVLRAEKGYPIVGQDTDGTVTPQDLGMEWIVSKKKADFVGRRSYARADTSRPDRRHLVGLLPEDPGVLLPEGAHLVSVSAAASVPSSVASAALPAVPPVLPVPALGFVTSSYRSAALGRTFALALVSGGRGRVGERLYAPVGDDLVPVTVTSHVLYDPEGARRDG